MSELDADNYGQLLVEIKQRIRSAQYEALKVVNQKLIALYWDIGKSIVIRQQGENWGKSVVEQLAKDLQPPIGIILCKSKQRTIVEYALKESNQPIGVATYRIVSTLPQELKDQLPKPEQVARLLEGME